MDPGSSRLEQRSEAGFLRGRGRVGRERAIDGGGHAALARAAASRPRVVRTRRLWSARGAARARHRRISSLSPEVPVSKHLNAPPRIACGGAETRQTSGRGGFMKVKSKVKANGGVEHEDTWSTSR